MIDLNNASARRAMASEASQYCRVHPFSSILRHIDH